MIWNELHATILARTFEKILGKGESGTMAFVRCLTPEVVETLATDLTFSPLTWEIRRVADANNASTRTIKADRAVEMRETKEVATLLLVDTLKAGAGMDGIYSAAREVDEASLFKIALRLAAREVTRRMSRDQRLYAERAVKRARGYGHRFSVSLWTEFDFLIRVASSKKHLGALLHLLGLWPVQESETQEGFDGLDFSRLFVDRLLGLGVSGLTPARRIQGLRLLHPSEDQLKDLEMFLRRAATKPLFSALAELANKPHLWVNALRVESAAKAIQTIELLSWRTNTGKLAKWSGLTEEGDPKDPPVLILEPDAEKTGDYSKVEIRWKARPENLEKGAVEYRVSVVTDMDEEITSREVPHSEKKYQKYKLSNDDFVTLSEDEVICVKIVISVVGNDSIESQESEEFVIRFGRPPEHPRPGLGRKVRTFSEGMIELEDREMVSVFSSAEGLFPVDSKGFLLLRTPQRGKSFRVFRPSLIHETEKQWIEKSGQIGRWRIKVRASGAPAGSAEFVPFDCPQSVSKTFWDRTVNASSRMAERFQSCGGGVGQIYDENAKHYNAVVKEYLLAWSALFKDGHPFLALANTVEVQLLSGRTIGLIVLPNYPLRVCWHAAYDNLVLHAAFQQEMSPKDIREEMAILDGAMFPAMLPGLDGKSSFVFADTLGFHAVGMVLDSDKEPKAAIALLARALGESETADSTPTVGKKSAQILGKEISKYLECHTASKLLHVHALRPGDGLTVARSLGYVQQRYSNPTEEEELEDGGRESALAFVLELYPSEEQRGIAGRFIAEAREKRRSGAGLLSVEDYWMLESLSLPGGVALPRLRWARKREQDPKTPAHLAIAFDTFESKVIPESKEMVVRTRPFYAYGLLSFFEREYSTVPSPRWYSFIPSTSDGEKHPSDRMHTDRLLRLQQGILKCVVRNLDAQADLPTLRTEIPPDKVQHLNALHGLCDWVITLDRNAGIEYFDSPMSGKDVYDAYVIDCVPEREDLGCLQLITSTSNLDEIRRLLDRSLDQMGLSRSLRNAQFLLAHLKSLSGRLAIRLTGQKAPTSELIALALCHANCWDSTDNNDCWVSLRNGFFIPVDDVQDLLPPIKVLSQDGDGKAVRPDLIYVSVVPRKGLLFQFIEVKYRRHLRAARNPAELLRIQEQTESLRNRWGTWYSHEATCSSFRAIRRAKLARVLRFYADKAHRHYLPRGQYEILVSEIDSMIERGGDYAFAESSKVDRGWVFCPEYAGANPLQISPLEWNTSVFLFGPNLLPDLSFYRESENTHPKPVDASPDQPTKQNNNGCEVLGTLEGSESSDGLPKNRFQDGMLYHEDVSETADETTPTVCFGTDVLTGAEVKWPLRLKGNPHLLVAGLPGMGKTTCLLNMCKQMLEAGIRPILFSYHQDIDEKIADLPDSVRFIDFHGLGFNPLQIIDRKNKLAYLDVAGALRDIFVAIFPELGDIQGEHIRRAVKESFVEAGWDGVDRGLADLREPEFKRFVEILKATPKPDRGLRTLLARFEELEDYGFFDHGESQESLWESRVPIVIRIHTTQNDNLQKAFASLVLYGLYKDMFRRGIKDRITHAVIFDEAHRAAGLKLIPTMAKECRKYGISLILASQEAKDFNVSLFSAIANYLVFRLTEVDAKALVRNVSSSQQERVLIDKLKQMDKFKALYFCEGKRRPAHVALLP